MAYKTQKKGPRRVTKPANNHIGEDLNRQTLDAEVDAFIKKVHGTIQDARAKMSDEQIEKADKEADAILKAASDSVKSSRHSA